MLKVKIYTVGRSKETWLIDAVTEYEKRLKGRMELEWILAKDDPQLIEWALPESHLIALDPKGQLLTSEEFSRKIVQLGSRFSFLIGGSDGIPEILLKKAPWRWSLSPLTFTHQMTRLILAEQLYRALEIERKSPYHK